MHLFNIFEERYADGGMLLIEIWMVEGKPHRRYRLPWGERYKPKPEMEADVAYKVHNGRERPLQEVWEEVLPMLTLAE